MDRAKAELLRTLGRLVRGLSTLFWTLPAGLLIYLQTARTDWLAFLGDAAVLPAALAGMAFWYSLRQLRYFQKQERVWHLALHRAEILAAMLTGLAPFLFWWHRFPEFKFYTVSVSIFVFTLLLFLLQLNQVLRRLCAMLPDENLREETKMFTAFNTVLFAGAAAGLVIFFWLTQARTLPFPLSAMVSGQNPRVLWLILFLSLLPFAMTMAILWKIKEVIFQSIFEAEH